MSTPRTTRRQTRRAAGVLASTVRGGSRTHMRPSLAKARLPWADGQMRILDTAELERGPLAVDSELNRSGILAEPIQPHTPAPGIPLSVTIRLRDRGNDCAPWIGAQVEVSQPHPAGHERDGSASPRDFPEGRQITGDDGSVIFQTVYPAWRKDRTVSMEVRIRTFDDQARTFSWKTRVVFVHPQEREHAERDAIALRGSDSDGYTATVEVALDGGAAARPAPAETEPAPTRLLHAHVERTPGDRRALVLTIEARQRTSLSVRLAGPSGQLLIRRRATVAFGTHTLRAEIPARAHAGAARLALAMSTDAGTEHCHLRIAMPSATA